MKNKRHAINRPHLFKRQNYNYWKQRRITFFVVCHIDMWDIVENGEYIPTNKDGTEIPKSSWNNDKKKQENMGHFSSSLRRNVTGKRFQDKYACTLVRIT
ncbi:hypothetical protein CR513_09517, partial [Mucuna pruriens]